MTKKRFDCVEMKRQAAAPINERLQRMTPEQQIAYWKERSDAFFLEYGDDAATRPAPSDKRASLA